MSNTQPEEATVTSTFRKGAKLLSLLPKVRAVVSYFERPLKQLMH